MTQVDCEVLRTFRNAIGESFVRVRQIPGDSWYYGDGAELGGCPLAPKAPWVENPPAPQDFEPMVYNFHLLHAVDIDKFVAGSTVIFKPGVPRFRR